MKRTEQYAEQYIDIVPHLLYNGSMKYYTTKQIAERWNISDRRVRTLCREGRIEGIIEKRKGNEAGKGRVSYLIPETAGKPQDHRYAECNRPPAYLLKWDDITIGSIDDNFEVDFFEPEFNDVVWEYTHGERHWDRRNFEEFLAQRVPGPSRRDIDKILFRCALSTYDVIRLGIATRAVNSRDLIWIARFEDEKMSEVTTDVFKSVFGRKKDMEGDSVDTPEGQNIKRYGVCKGNYGIFKKRLTPLTTDIESEIAVYRLAELMNVPACPAMLVDKDTVFSQFLYDFSREYIVHMRQLFKGTRGTNEYQNLVSVRPQYQKQFAQMIALDFITRQDDRHLSNIAVKITKNGESFYPLYDNGRSLFYEDTEETVAKAIKDIIGFASCFGPDGTYLDFVNEIKDNGVNFGYIMNLNVKQTDVKRILEESGFKDYRLDGGMEWIFRCIEMLKK